jgi:hypothetical protein
MHVVIRRYQTDPGSVGEIMRHVNEGFTPIIKDAEGFLAYYALNAGEIATVSVFEDQAGADHLRRISTALFGVGMLAVLLVANSQLVHLQ